MALAGLIGKVLLLLLLLLFEDIDILLLLLLLLLYILKLLIPGTGAVSPSDDEAPILFFFIYEFDEIKEAFSLY